MAPPLRDLRCATVVLLFVLIGCVGVIDPPRGASGTDPLDPVSPPFVCAPGEIQAGSALGPVRLSNSEYLASVGAVLGEEIPGLDRSLLSDQQSLQLETMRGFYEAAQYIANEVVSDTARRNRVVGCDPVSDRSGCVRDFIERFAARAYRRPLTGASPAMATADTEVGRLLALASAIGATIDPSITDPLETHADIVAVIQAVLLAPEFLTRIETGQPVAGRADIRQLDGYEVASRLSYFFLGEPPDEALLSRAREGTLDTPEGIRTEAERILDDPRARTRLDQFFESWLRLSTVRVHNFEGRAAGLAGDMATEIELLVSEYAWPESGSANLLDVFDASHTYVNTALAELYGVASIPGPAEGFVRVDLAPETERGGLLSTAGLLSLSSTTRTSPIGRGYFVRASILCDPPPPPPAGVADFVPQDDDTAVDALRRHATDPVCASCHRLMDPIGLGLEMYGPDAAVRSVDEAALRAEGTFVAGLEAPDFFGGPELGELVRGTEMTSDCVVQQFYRWGLGRDAAEDDCARAALEERFMSSGGSFRELVLSLVTSDAFRFKRFDPAAELDADGASVCP